MIQINLKPLILQNCWYGTDIVHL